MKLRQLVIVAVVVVFLGMVGDVIHLAQMNELNKLMVIYAEMSSVKTAILIVLAAAIWGDKD